MILKMICSQDLVSSVFFYLKVKSKLEGHSFDTMTDIQHVLNAKLSGKIPSQVDCSTK